MPRFLNVIVDHFLESSALPKLGLQNQPTRTRNGGNASGQVLCLKKLDYVAGKSGLPVIYL
jgi:hypothetical protein